MNNALSKGKPPQVAIFGWGGTGKTSSGKLIAQGLGFEFISTGNIFRNMATRRGISPQELEHVAKKDESVDREIDDFIIRLGGIRSHILVESRLAHHFMQDAIKIKFDCTDEERFRRIAQREHISPEEAAQQTLEREQAIVERYKKLYGIVDFADRKHFHYIVDTTHNTLEMTVAQTITTVQYHLKHGPS
jgi:cytidylate kinase